MKIYYLKKLSKSKIIALQKRSAVNFDLVLSTAQAIVTDVKQNGDRAIRKYCKRFDGVNFNNFLVTNKEISQATRNISPDVKKAFAIAKNNITAFHRAQIKNDTIVQTMPGIKCFTKTKPIEKVGLYVPGGSAPLPSTVLMLATPARLAGCREIVMCTPTQKDGRVPDIVLYAANICGIKKIYKIGGAQAIAGMAYGTKSIPKVYKIFGPGNAFVTAAKMTILSDPNGAAIDMPAGPSEVMIIADANARIDFVASDLLSQAEHGKDSQAILICMSKKYAKAVNNQIGAQIKKLPRQLIARQALKNSFIVIVDNLISAMEFSNSYAPEHLIINTRNSNQLVNKVINAGSVFLGEYSCESAGDYASGTNHTLPTYGLARAYSGVNMSSFQKIISFQKVFRSSLKILGPVVQTMASQEGLSGHERAMAIRCNK